MILFYLCPLQFRSMSINCKWRTKEKKNKSNEKNLKRVFLMRHVKNRENQQQEGIVTSFIFSPKFLKTRVIFFSRFFLWCFLEDHVPFQAANKQIEFNWNYTQASYNTYTYLKYLTRVFFYWTHHHHTKAATNFILKTIK